MYSFICSPKKLTSQDGIIPSSALYSLFTRKRSEAEPVEKDQQNCKNFKNRRDELQKQVLVYTTKQQTNSLICFASFLLQLSLMAPAMWMFQSPVDHKIL
jgi:hypothetical protein